MNKDYIQKYYRFEREHWWFAIRERIIVQVLKKSIPSVARNKPLKILNVGAATGKTTEMLQQFGEVTTVETDDYAIDFLQNKLGISVVNASVEALPFSNNFFDVICLFDVIEHVNNQHVAIEELYRVSKEQGLLYCTTPAFSFLWSNHDTVNQHYRRYTSTSLKNLLQPKFIIEYLSYFNFFLFFPIVCYRFVRNLFFGKQQQNSDFENGIVFTNSIAAGIFRFIFSIEIPLLKWIKFPFGVSIITSARKASLPG
jgi:SAM-dependent methyltransferase